MKALTLTQPWATLVAYGAKMIETRSWSTNYRGPLAIHAAAGFPKWALALCDQKPFASVLPKCNIGEPRIDLPRGKVLATCEMVACIRIGATPVIYDLPEIVRRIGAPVTIPPRGNELAFGDYRPGRYAWLLANIDRLDTYWPAVGKLGLWEWVGEEVTP